MCNFRHYGFGISTPHDQRQGLVCRGQQVKQEPWLPAMGIKDVAMWPQATTHESFSDEDRANIKRLERAKKSSRRVAPTLPSLLAKISKTIESSAGGESFAPPFSTIGQVKEIVETVRVVETTVVHSTDILEHEVRGEEGAEMAMGAAEMLYSEPLDPEDREEAEIDVTIKMTDLPSKI
ncbi:hypothetical protein Nepgr_025330 [Nepenthes gracilis]|uniref:Uncharacterized protein n=1 Tax=Nepenthes gracilis TaxID=150966 RepID=A0AAD3XZE9_NEPGR|nr:hypothetical protein Nepgr_025330 [Nepenthes gracilis]